MRDSDIGRNRSTRWTAALTVAGLSSACEPAGGQSLNGTYSIPVAGSTATFSLAVQPDGTAAGWLRSGDGSLTRAQGRQDIGDDGLPRVDGTFAGAMVADFTLSEGDPVQGFLLVVTPHDGSGQPQPTGAMVFSARRLDVEAQELDPAQVPGRVAEPGPSTPTATTAFDPRLVGVWSTQVVMNGDAGSVATQLLLEFTSDGVLRELGSRALGGFGSGSIDTGSGGGGDHASWRVERDLLVVSYQGSDWVPLARFGFSDGRLVLRYVQDGSVQIWSRER